MARHCYLVAYDIRCPRRLRRVHYRLSKHGLPVQYSVFVVDDSRTLNKVLESIGPHLDKADDLRCYKARSADEIWLYGRDTGSRKTQHNSWWARLSGWLGLRRA